jgi:hypothetical protein
MGRGCESYFLKKLIISYHLDLIYSPFSVNSTISVQWKIECNFEMV